RRHPTGGRHRWPRRRRLPRGGHVRDGQTRRAVVVEGGLPKRYSPELQRQMELARQGGPAPAIQRSEAQAHRWVRRTNDTEWVPIASEAGGRIVTEWAQPGPDGITPVALTP
ncbi:MAG: hypothetical protein ACKPGK_13235, partial [Verrucomicrobiota bacterium]